ncbi:hypothetical protein ACFU7X_00985 [Streptomyces chartreusis]|uniref:hypothetical protein n=1 Tax=Streptomyces chartreusis TaxID=1969 RepID=UPI0036CB0733
MNLEALTTRGRQRLPSGDAPSKGRVGGIAAFLILLGSLCTVFGLSWDIQWHQDVGPDTFFTLPHLILYSGSALVGATSLMMVLLVTAAQRAGRPTAQYGGGKPVRVLGGVFRAPLGYLIAGIGGALFLLFGLLDLWWHSLYGFDAVLNSPPHVGLILSVSFAMAGSIIVFAAAREQAWGKAGVVVSSLVFITFSPITVEAFSGLPLPADPMIVGTVFFSVVLLITGVFVLRFRGAALVIAAALGLLQAILWWFSPWAAHTYADSVGLPLRDVLRDVPPVLPARIPMFMVVVAAVVDGMLWLGRTYGWNARMVPQIMGAGGGLAVGLSMLLQNSLLSDAGSAPSVGDLMFMALFGMAAGALAGFVAARLAVLLRDNPVVPKLSKA